MRFLAVYLIGVALGYCVIPDAAIYSLLNIVKLISLGLFFGIAIGSIYQNIKLFKLISAFFYIFLVVLGWQHMWKNHPNIDESHFSRQPSQGLVGFIEDEPKKTNTGVRFPLKILYAVENGKIIKSTGVLSINLRVDTSDKPSYQYGDKLLIPTRFAEIAAPNNPNEFNYQSYLAGKSIWHQINLNETGISVLGEDQGSFLRKQALVFRQNMVAKMDQGIQDEDALAVASALILGYRSDFDPDLLNIFSVTGTIHVLSVSGLHVGIVFVVFSTLLFWMKGKRSKVIRAILLILLIWLYALVTGLAPSVLRASIMISFGIIAFSFARKGNVYNTIAASAFLLLLYNPHFISEIGFKLSYLAVLGIVFFYPKLNSLYKFNNKLLSTLWSSAAISVSAQIATFPLVLYYFHFFPVYFLPANILVILPVSVIVYIGLLVLVVPYGILHDWLSWMLEYLISKMNFVLGVFQTLPYATLGGIYIQPWEYILMYIIILGAIWCVFYKKKKGIYLVLICLVILSANRAIKKIQLNSLEEIRIYNVYRNMGVGFFDRGTVSFLTDSLTEESQRFQYSIASDLEASAGGKPVLFLNGDGLADPNNLAVQDNIIQFGSKSILLYRHGQLFENHLFIDLVYLRNNQEINLEDLQKNIQFSLILVDGSNSNSYIEKIIKEAEKIDVPIYNLKNNFAYVW